MARCPYLEYVSGGSLFGTGGDKFYCKLTGKEMDWDSSQLKNTCKVDYGEEYLKCPAYKNR